MITDSNSIVHCYPETALCVCKQTFSFHQNNSGFRVKTAIFQKQISICQAFSTLNPQIPKQQNLPASGSGGILHIYKLKSSEPERMYC